MFVIHHHLFVFFAFLCMPYDLKTVYRLGTSSSCCDEFCSTAVGSCLSVDFRIKYMNNLLGKSAAFRLPWAEKNGKNERKKNQQIKFGRNDSRRRVIEEKYPRATTTTTRHLHNLYGFSGTNVKEPCWKLTIWWRQLITWCAQRGDGIESVLTESHQVGGRGEGSFSPAKNGVSKIASKSGWIKVRNMFLDRNMPTKKISKRIVFFKNKSNAFTLKIGPWRGFGKSLKTLHVFNGRPFSKPLHIPIKLQFVWLVAGGAELMYKSCEASLLRLVR